jgi:hypothetical protein
MSSHDLTQEQIRAIIIGAVRMERARIGTMLAQYATSIVDDKSDNAEKAGVSKLEKETAQLAVGTFAAVFIQKLAEEPLPVVCVHCIDGTHDAHGKVH